MHFSIHGRLICHNKWCSFWSAGCKSPIHWKYCNFRVRPTNQMCSKWNRISIIEIMVIKDKSIIIIIILNSRSWTWQSKGNMSFLVQSTGLNCDDIIRLSRQSMEIQRKNPHTSFIIRYDKLTYTPILDKEWNRKIANINTKLLMPVTCNSYMTEMGWDCGKQDCSMVCKSFYTKQLYLGLTCCFQLKVRHPHISPNLIILPSISICQ